MIDGMEDIEQEETYEETETPMTEEATEPEEESAGAIRIPMAAIGRSVEPGETITLRVVSSDEDGISAEIVEAEAETETEEGYEEPDAAFNRMAQG